MAEAANNAVYYIDDNSHMIFVGNNTYAHREVLKMHGFKWDKASKTWWAEKTPERLAFCQEKFDFQEGLPERFQQRGKNPKKDVIVALHGFQESLSNLYATVLLAFGNEFDPQFEAVIKMVEGLAEKCDDVKDESGTPS
jgi:hypothetical protein